jgi:predicted MFS family arabinose efflux permease
MPTPDQTTAITSLIAIFTPAIVDVIKRDTWKPQATVLLGLLISTGLYLALHFLMGSLPWPWTLDFVWGLLAVFGMQQLTYQLVYKDRQEVVPAAPVVTEGKTTVIVGDVKESS